MDSTTLNNSCILDVNIIGFSCYIYTYIHNLYDLNYPLLCIYISTLYTYTNIQHSECESTQTIKISYIINTYNYVRNQYITEHLIKKSPCTTFTISYISINTEI